MKILTIILTVLSAFFTNLENRTLQSDFVATVTEQADAPENFPGTITMRGSQFILSVGEVDAAFDGKTMYMYSAETDELTLTNPTEEELLDSNPFLMAKAIAEVCTIVERGNEQQTVITLTPNDRSLEINRFVLKVRTMDLMPLQLEMREGTKVSTLKLINPMYVNAIPPFTIQPDETTFVNDMRF